MGEICEPAFAPSFKLDHGEKIFTIGSCFARNIEVALASRGFDVVTGRLSWPDQSVDTAAANNMLNNYGVASIANELGWALDPSSPFDPDLHVVELTPGQFMDLHVATGHGVSRETVLACRSAITEVTRRVTECRVVIMTLGLSELWFDALSGSYLNRAPPRSIVGRFPTRFEVHLLSPEETISIMRGAISLLKTFCRADQRVLLTVSPVPLNATFTGGDVIVTNSYSKAVLRTVAEQISMEYDHIDYFPSYESVMLSERVAAWLPDGRHVRPEVIASNVGRMIQAYSPASPDQIDELAVKTAIKLAAEEAGDKNWQRAIALLEPFTDAIASDAQFASIYAEVCLKLGRIDDAKRAHLAVPQADSWRQKLLGAEIDIQTGRADQGLKALLSLSEEDRGRARVLKTLIDAYVELERYDDALITARTLVRSAPRALNVFRRIAEIHVRRGDAAAADAAFRQAFRRTDNSPAILIDYAEFLISQKRLQEAADVLVKCVPETKGQRWRIDELLGLLPSASGKRSPPLA